MELIVMFKYFLYRIDFQKLRGTTGSDITTQIGNLVVKFHIAFLAQHAHRCQEQLFAAYMFLLIDGNNTIRKIQQTLQFIIIADSQDRVWTTKSCQRTSCSTRCRVGDNALTPRRSVASMAE